MEKNRPAEDRPKKPDIDISSIGMNSSEVAWDHWNRGVAMFLLPILGDGLYGEMYMEYEGDEIMIEFESTIH